MDIFSMVVWLAGLAVVGAAVERWLKLRAEALKTRAGASAEVQELTRRVEALEKQCAKLQEQVLDAHALLADEQRQLDRKLTAMLPDAPAALPLSPSPTREGVGEGAARKPVSSPPERARI